MKIKAERLREVLRYNPDTGQFIRLAKTGSKGRIGQIVGGMSAGGYVAIGIDGHRHYAHRLAFIYMTGECPPLIDLVDQNKSNNTWANLRDASKGLNAVNSKKNARNRSGFRGVSWHAVGQKWQAHCGPRYLGLFETREAAHAAYLKAAEGYSCSVM